MDKDLDELFAIIKSGMEKFDAEKSIEYFKAISYLYENYITKFRADIEKMQIPIAVVSTALFDKQVNIAVAGNNHGIIKGFAHMFDELPALKTLVSEALGITMFGKNYKHVRESIHEIAEQMREKHDASNFKAKSADDKFVN